MSTRNTLASVSEAQVRALRAGERSHVEPSATFCVSHRIVERMELEPVRNLLQRAVNGGVEIGVGTRKDARPARVHGPRATVDLAAELEVAWTELHRNPAFQLHRLQDWWSAEVDMVLQAFRHAASHGECIVSDVRSAFEGRVPARSTLLR